MSKKLLASLLLATSLLGLTGCGSSSSTDNSSSDKEKELQATIDSQSEEIKKLKEELAAKEQQENKASDTSKEYQVGDTVEFKGLKFKLKTVNFDWKRSDYINNEQPKDGHNINFEIQVTNDSKEKITPRDFVYVDLEEDGITSDKLPEVDTTGIESIDDNEFTDVDSMRPKTTITKWIVDDYKFKTKDLKMIVTLTNPSNDMEQQEFIFNLNSVMKDAPKK